MTLSSSKINTPGWQDSAFISPDGKNLYFAYVPYLEQDLVNIVVNGVSESSITDHGPYRPGAKSTTLMETYCSTRTSYGSWGVPVNLDVNRSDYALYAAKTSFANDKLVYVIRDVGGYGQGDICISQKLPWGEWSPPVNMGTNINTSANEDTPCFGPDGKTLYFARNLYGDGLGWEIMASKLINGVWGMAQKLPEPINQPNPSQTANHQPFVSADGNEFYFTRITQIYCSVKQPDGSWGEPAPVLPQLQVSGHASLTADGKYLYFLTALTADDLAKQHWSICYAVRQADGTWGDPIPVD